MRRISYGRIFMGGLVVNAALFLIVLLMQLIALAFSDDPVYIKEELITFARNILLESPCEGLLCMLILALFGKKEKSVPRQEESKERIVYVVTDKEKSPKETEDISRYMPR